MTEKKKTGKPNPQDVINTATGVGGGVSKPIIDAGTKPPNEPKTPQTGVAGDTADISEKKKK